MAGDERSNHRLDRILPVLHPLQQDAFQLLHPRADHLERQPGHSHCSRAIAAFLALLHNDVGRMLDM